MMFTALERKLLAALVVLMASGYAVSALERLFANHPAAGADRPAGQPDAGPAMVVSSRLDAALGEEAGAGPAGAVEPAGDPVRDRGHSPFVDGLLNLNRADRLELEALPGIGPTLAGRILEYRAAIGGFDSFEELLQVKGIGPRTLARLSDYVTTQAPCSLHAPGVRFSDCPVATP